ncbi:accessory Sec system protein Asp3 [Limosilactobacillus albertensis]|uniref:Accessory Sec system protein Asp3 n=1 Tax=Limosilactobacillus albertensis TaxID=2759752 RepID=A0A839H1Q8_9LACO|nr:accessory Sec system protein Asp3 [Limosilactobacillus albertensis]MBB1124525.1 accessory Sec system protein Asp3 [Limosilactobacillus albertensis]MCD7123058.1 accessory Sec system protein Asp3 [Limosilactobacillus albertensis]
MQQYVNQGYWEPTNEYPAGSQVTINDDASVEFHNSLMAPGKVIMAWESVHSYQATKLVPQLPILRNDHHYRLRVNAQAQPIYSLIIRITFFDAQEHEISHLEFQQKALEFVYPASAVQYRVELINNGLTDLTFQRFEICDADLPVTVHEDVWIHNLLNENKPGKLNVLLVADSKRTRKTLGGLKDYSPYRVQPISIAWQSNVDSVETIKSWLINSRELNANVISTTPKLDHVALSLKMAIPSITAVVTNRVTSDSDLADVTYPVVVPLFWSSSVLVNPDWPIIFSTIQKINSKEE